jgi:hypothetical protein
MHEMHQATDSGSFGVCFYFPEESSSARHAVQGSYLVEMVTQRERQGAGRIGGACRGHTETQDRT